jgi:hypothetical protein
VQWGEVAWYLNPARESAQTFNIAPLVPGMSSLVPDPHSVLGYCPSRRWSITAVRDWPASETPPGSPHIAASDTLTSSGSSPPTPPSSPHPVTIRTGAAGAASFVHALLAIAAAAAVHSPRVEANPSADLEGLTTNDPVREVEAINNEGPRRIPSPIPWIINAVSGVPELSGLEEVPSAEPRRTKK